MAARPELAEEERHQRGQVPACRRSGGTSTVLGNSRSSAAVSGVVAGPGDRDRHPGRPSAPRRRALQRRGELAQPASGRACPRAGRRGCRRSPGQDVAHRLAASPAVAPDVGGVEDLQPPDGLASAAAPPAAAPACRRPARRRPPATRRSGRPSRPAGRRAARRGRSRPGPAGASGGVDRGRARCGSAGALQLDVDDDAGAPVAVARPGGCTSAPSRPRAGPRRRTAGGRWSGTRGRAPAGRPGRPGRAPPRAWSLSITTSPVDGEDDRRAVRRQVRRYSCSSSSSLGAGVGEQRLPDLLGGGLGQRQQQRAGVLAPAGEVDRADGPAGDRVVDRHAGAGEVLEVLGVVLVAEHVRRAAHLQRGADAVGADELLGVAEAGGQQDPVEVPLERRGRRSAGSAPARSGR